MSFFGGVFARSPLLYRLEVRRRVLASRWTRRGVVARYLAAADPPRLQIGSGTHLLAGVATPDLAWVGSLAVPPLSDDRARYVAWMSAQLELAAPDPAVVVHARFRAIEAVPGAGHQYLYSFDALRGPLERAGFRDVVRCAVQESAEAGLRGIDGHGAAVGSEEIARLETLVVEAVRP